MKRIRARIDPCKCGCAGRDPWHAASFQRVVRKVIEVDPTPAVTRWGVRSTIVARGTARFPWGADAVGLLAVKCSTGRWVTYGWALLEDMA